MAIKSKPDRYLKKRGGVFHYYRRVPSRFEELDTRGTIRVSLKTGSLEIARMRRDNLETADEEYWGWLSVSEADGVLNAAHSSAIAKRYSAAQARALAMGFTYKPVEELASPTNLEDIVSRLLSLRLSESGEVVPHQAEAVLGGIEEPRTTVSEALQIYFDDIAIDDQIGKSKQQKYQWQKVKRLSISYFIEVVGDLPLADITRDDTLEFQRWWKDRMLSPPKGEKAVTANTANRHIGNLRLLHRAYFTHIGEEDRPISKLVFQDEIEDRGPGF